MKKIFWIAAAALFAVVGCSKPDAPGTEPVEEKDEISVSPQNAVVDNGGRNVQVVVSSTGEWALAGKDDAKYDWVTPDKTSGEDGDVVKFTVKPNDGEERVAEFVFSCGEATAPFMITSLAGDMPTLALTAESEVTVGFKAGKFEATVSYELMTKDDITVTIPETAAEWLTHEATVEGELVNSAKLMFSYARHDGLDPREATIVVAAEKANPVEIKFRQMPEPTLRAEQNSYKLGAEAGTLEIAVKANVEYEISYGEGSDWLTAHRTEGNVEKWSYDAMSEGGKREATIIFTEKNPAEGTEAIIATVLVKQSNAIINTAAYMKTHYAGAGEEGWKTPDALKLGKTFTIEAYIRHDEVFTKPSGWGGNQIGTIFGLERRFLVRHGDNRNNLQQWELVYAQNAKESNGDNKEVKVTSSKPIPAAEWVHIAVVFNESENRVSLYQDGELAGSATMHSDMKEVDLTETYTSNNTLQQFYLGRSYNDERDFEGLMSEVRIWKKALTAEEISAKNHFYGVPVNSEGLVAYWKLDDGAGTVFKDYTDNGNDLVCKAVSYGSLDNLWRDVDIP